MEPIALPSKPANGPQLEDEEHKTSATKLLERKQRLLELQEQLDQEKASYALKVRVI